MKKKGLALLLIIAVAFSLMACTSNDAGDSKDNSQETAAVQTDAGTQSGGQSDALDTSLTDSKLIASINNDRPKKLKIAMEMKTLGVETSMVTYYDGDKMRVETDVPDVGKSVLIYLPEQEVMYSYMEGNEQGIKMTGASTTYAEDMDLMVDDSELFADITDETAKNMSAKVTTLDGEEVIYIEANDTDEEMGEVLVKMWYSVKYGTPLKYEVAVGEQTMMELTVTEIQKDIAIDQSLFTPPSDISFQEADMKTMIDD